MPIDPVRRVMNWDSNFDTDQVKARMDKKRADMLARVQSVFALIATMESQVKQVLDLAGVSIILYPSYLSFGRELWHLTHGREVSGESASVEAELLIVKWVARGLARSVLETIRTGVFNIAPPSSP